jgi:hypothetical protein
VVLTPYAGPKTFAKEYKREELERLAEEVARLTRELEKNQAPLPVGVILRAAGALVFDALNRVHPPAAGLIVQLPRATATDGGRGLDVAILSAVGAVTFVPVGALVNDATSFAPGAAVGLVRFRWDGSGWWV